MTKQKKNYQGTIFLKNDLGLQEVYSSQNYGTFYSIYMAFDCVQDIKDKEKVKIKNLKFEIVNYKGVLNLGIVNVIWKPKADEKSAIFEIEVEAMTPKRCFTFPEEKEFKIDLKIYDKIVIERTLLKMSAFNLSLNPNDNLVFDDEFYYRDGLEFVVNPGSGERDNRRIERPGMEGAGNSSSGKRCYQVIHKIAM